MDETSSFLALPPLDGAEYLVTLLFEAGLVQSTGMGIGALSWSEIESWLRVTQMDLSTWEKLTIKTMSEVYASELSVATKRDHPAPYVYVDEVVVANRDAVADKIRNAFAFFKRTKNE